MLSTLVCSCGPASRGCSRSNIETTASLWQACRFAAVLSLPYLNMSYVSEEEGMVTVHELGDLHPVTLAILMSINVTDKEFTACTWLADGAARKPLVWWNLKMSLLWIKKSNGGKNSTNEKRSECRWRVRRESEPAAVLCYLVSWSFTGEIDVFHRLCPRQRLMTRQPRELNALFACQWVSGDCR